MIIAGKEIRDDMRKRRKGSQKALLLTMLACLAFLGLPARIIGRTGIANAQAVNTQDSASYFWGTSDDAQHCGGAFLLYLDQSRNTGGIFIVTKMEKFRSLTFGNSGDLQFEWTSLGDVNYRFSGHFTQEGFSGDISQEKPKTHEESYLCELSATRLILKNELMGARSQINFSRFTNEGYSSDGGDPTGVDIRFLSTKNGTVGMITFYAGLWDEPMFTPLVLTNIQRNGSVIRFDARVSDGLRHYRLTVNARGGLFCRVEQDSQEKHSCTPLRTDRHVLPLIDW